MNSKRIMETARLWKKQAMRQRGHFVIYTTDGSRFMIPLVYLNHPIFRELFLMAEEKFGFTGCDPLRMPCEAFNASKELEKASVSMASCRAYLASVAVHQTNPANMIQHVF
ncbi:hypothetical protein AMTRI_Chr09g14560 [Amborella trichopoda]